MTGGPANDDPAGKGSSPHVRSGAISVTHVTVRYALKTGPLANQAPAVEGVSFDVRPGEFVAIIGPTGCGKSTLLKAVAGLIPLSAGSVSLGGDEAARVGFMFQTDALLPWRTASANVELALRLAARHVGGGPGTTRLVGGAASTPEAGSAADSGPGSGAHAAVGSGAARLVGSRASRAAGSRRVHIRRRARELLASVGLADSADKYPGQLSGGMRKRVAMARALAYEPSVFLMDEPFSALDAQTRIQVGNFFLKILEASRQTVLFVTHDIEEAVALADRVLVMSRGPGRIATTIDVSLGRPRDYYATRFTPGFGQLQQQVWDALGYSHGARDDG